MRTMQHPNHVAEQLASRRGDRHQSGIWPAIELEILKTLGVFRSMLPTEFGGTGLDYDELLRDYRTIASGSLAVALAMTQRDGACDLIARSDNPEIPRRLLPAHARGDLFASIGISQLTTSKGADLPKLRAVADGPDFVLHGFMPWVTGAKWCDQIVTAAVMDDGSQIVACLERDDAGLEVHEPMKLLALQASHTSRVDCHGLSVPVDRLLRKPHPAALSDRAPVKALTVSAVGMGLADSIRGELDKIRARQPDPMQNALARLDHQFQAVEAQFAGAARQVVEDGTDESSPTLRVAVNTLVTHLGIALVNMSKGRGFILGHPAEQLMREALFFQVWSSPPGTQSATLDRLLLGQ